MHWLWLMWRLRQLAGVILPFHSVGTSDGTQLIRFSAGTVTEATPLVQNHSFYKPSFSLMAF